MCAAGDHCTLYVGQRVESQGCHGTVRYVGEVSNQTGVWVGVEWDDVNRGKHDGSHNGKRYFNTSHPTSGSFVRLNKINTGYSCVKAIHSRYGKIQGSMGGIDTALLHEIQRELKAPIFEVVGFDRVNEKQSDFQNLKVVVLTNEPVSCAGEPGQLSAMCPHIVELNLSRTLIANWKTLADITQQVPHLSQLDISNNRLLVPSEEDIPSLQCSFKQIRHIVMCNVGYTWNQILFCARLWPNIEVLMVPNNNIVTLETPEHGVLSQLKQLLLSQNPLLNWEEVNKLGKLERLEMLGANETGLKEIVFPGEKATNLFPSLKTLWVANNVIADWNSINALNKLHSLESLIIHNNPIVDGWTGQGSASQMIIARIKCLKKLNGSEITDQERKGCEYDYMKLYGKAWLAVQDNSSLLKNFHVMHPRYAELVEMHGAFGEDELVTKSAPLKSRMISVTIFSANDCNKSYFKKKVPKDMSIQKLLGLAQKLIDTGGKTPVLTAISAKAPDAKVVLENVLQDLSYYSVEDGDSIDVQW